MTAVLSRAAVAEAAAGGLALLAAVVTGDAALVALAAPLCLLAAVGLATGRPAAVDVAVSVEPRLAAGALPFRVGITANSAAAQRCVLELVVPPGLAATGPVRWDLALRAGVPEEVSVEVRALRSGRFHLGEVAVLSERHGGGRRLGGRAGEAVVVESWPDPLKLRELVRAERVRAQAGDRAGRQPDEGIELAEVREEPTVATGRRVNWRATARRQVTCVNLQHPERSTDVVVLADTFSRASLPAVVRISVNLAGAYLARHDRTGLICFGGVLDWVEPGSGPAQADRIQAALLSSESYFSYAWKDADVIPRRLFPPGCLVLAVSPLTDDRFVRTVVDLRSRGMDVAVIELAPTWPPVPTAVTSGAGAVSSGELASRILAMEREQLRRTLLEMGVAVAGATTAERADVAVARLHAVRRALRRRAAV